MAGITKLFLPCFNNTWVFCLSTGLSPTGSIKLQCALPPTQEAKWSSAITCKEGFPSVSIFSSVVAGKTLSCTVFGFLESSLILGTFRFGVGVSPHARGNRTPRLHDTPADLNIRRLMGKMFCNLILNSQIPLPPLAKVLKCLHFKSLSHVSRLGHIYVLWGALPHFRWFFGRIAALFR